MERHRCKLCHRRFANGRALAGHMRSHRRLPSPSASSSPPLAAVEEKEKEKASATYALRENRRKSFRFADPEFSSSAAAAAAAAAAAFFFQDRESDAESTLHRWPKRPRGFPAERPAGDEPASSVSEASSEEDVARCLVLLSRDAWSKSEGEEWRSYDWGEVDGEYQDEEAEEEEEEEDGTGSRSQRRRSGFQCGICRKVFRSYQALGGHRASHKRMGMECVPTAARMRIHGEESPGATAARHDPKLWECPYCYRVFSSGQALGGHKRSHLSSAATATATTSPALTLPPPPSPFAANANNNKNGIIDLNLPAPSEEEPELSALSATDFARK